MMVEMAVPVPVVVAIMPVTSAVFMVVVGLFISAIAADYLEQRFLIQLKAVGLLY